MAAAKSLVLAAACGVLMMSDVNAASCRDPLGGMRVTVAADVVGLQKIEHEASDRLKGLDTRPFAALRDDARKLAAKIGPDLLLKAEEELKRCRNLTYPIRAICSGAGNKLADILDKHVTSSKPEYDKAAYADAAKECERLMGLRPLVSAIRGTD